MQANRRRDTEPERLLRSELHRRGLRYRTDLRFRAQERYVRPDIVFTRARVAVFVDGCFWHRCPEHGSNPRSNIGFWQAKFEATLRRDRADATALRDAGWTVIRVWEHELPGDAADRIAAELPRI
jgi:DNA mismatch endonuclease (patch repair protein)